MIYLDNSATTRPFDSVVDCMADAMRERWFNASAAYAPALSVEKEIRACRRRLAAAAGAQESGVLFTSCGTEGDNLAIVGTAETLHAPMNFVVSAIEHPAVAETVKRVERLGHEVRVLPVDAQGRVDTVAARALIDEKTALISCMQVSNETGAIQPIGELSEIRRENAPQARLHVDGVQGFLRVPLNMQRLGVDFYAVSGHKIHGPKGIGALMVQPGRRLVPQMTGGGQEGGMRSGTYDAPAILALGEAVRRMTDEPPAERLRALKLRLWQQLKDADGVFANGPDPADAERSAPHILSLSFDGVRGEVLRNALEGEGILVSTGSACSSHKQKVSGALLSMGLARSRADGTIRVSLGCFNTEEEMDRAAEAILRQVQVLRRYQRR